MPRGLRTVINAVLRGRQIVDWKFTAEIEILTYQYPAKPFGKIARPSIPPPFPHNPQPRKANLCLCFRYLVMWIEGNRDVPEDVTTWHRSGGSCPWTPTVLTACWWPSKPVCWAIYSERNQEVFTMVLQMMYIQSLHMFNVHLRRQVLLRSSCNFKSNDCLCS